MNQLRLFQVSTVTILNAGTTTITASQSGNENFEAAEGVLQELVINKAAQTITFDELPEKIVGDEAFELTASASSGLSVSYESSDETVATVSGSTVTILAVGTTTITASQIGNENYNEASAVAQSLNIIDPAKTTQTISFSEIESKTYGDPDFDLTATASSGLSVTFTSSDESVATISGNTVNIVGAGTTTITASQSGNDEFNAAADVIQQLVVNKAQQSITFDELPEKTINDEAFDLSASASSGLGVAFESSDETVATVSGNTVTIIGVGTTMITASQSGNENYEAATDVVQSLNIVDPSKSSQTISFSEIENKTYGDTDFDLTATASSGLSVSFTSADASVATITGSTVTIIGAGSTTITASQSGNDEFNAAGRCVTPTRGS